MWSLPVNLPLWALEPGVSSVPGTHEATDRSSVDPERMSTAPLPATPLCEEPDSRVIEPPLPAASKSSPATVRRDSSWRTRSPLAERRMSPPVVPDASIMPVTSMSP